MRIKFNDKIYRLKEIESGVDSLMELVELVEEPRYKHGDFFISLNRIAFILDREGKNGEAHHLFAIDIDDISRKYIQDAGEYAHCGYIKDCTIADQKAIKIIHDGLKSIGKRWNAEKKCIEDIPVYKDGDFLHSDWNGENITIIYRKRNCIRLYYHASKSNRIGLDFDKEGFWPDGGDFRLATESEKKELIDALAEVGKRWNADKKCVEDWLEPWSDDPKVGDWVIAWNNDMSLAVIGVKINATPMPACKHVLNNNNSYKYAVKFNGTRDHLEKIRSGKV